MPSGPRNTKGHIASLQKPAAKWASRKKKKEEEKKRKPMKKGSDWKKATKSRGNKYAAEERPSLAPPVVAVGANGTGPLFGNQLRCVISAGSSSTPRRIDHGPKPLAKRLPGASLLWRAARAADDRSSSFQRSPGPFLMSASTARTLFLESLDRKEQVHLNS